MRPAGTLEGHQQAPLEADGCTDRLRLEAVVVGTCRSHSSTSQEPAISVLHGAFLQAVEADDADELVIRVSEEGLATHRGGRTELRVNALVAFDVVVVGLGGLDATRADDADAASEGGCRDAQEAEGDNGRVKVRMMLPMGQDGRQQRRPRRYGVPRGLRRAPGGWQPLWLAGTDAQSRFQRRADP